MEGLEEYRKAGKIASEIREWSRGLIKPGSKALDIAEAIEKRILDAKAEIAFPLNISLNDNAAHYTPSYNDALVLSESDLVTIDLGVHVDGYIADTAYTIDLSGKNQRLVDASEAGLRAAIECVKPGVSVSKIGEAIETTIGGYGFKPIENLTGHELKQYNLHAGIAIPNIKVPYDWKVEEGMALAIEPFATNGLGKVIESKNAEIFSFLALKPTRMREGKILLQEVEKRGLLPFAERWYAKKMHPLKLKMILRELVEREALHSYPVLHEKEKGLVSQAEHTIIVTKDGCEVTTR
ncbi:MAG: type II methionyl aminopeptidase [Candidatus Altiarchaeota archaeon]|nr:type II methionyl aminopeptidase [Candidatus Altiarchaeota archaeon]